MRNKKAGLMPVSGNLRKPETGQGVRLAVSLGVSTLRRGQNGAIIVFHQIERD